MFEKAACYHLMNRGINCGAIFEDDVEAIERTKGEPWAQLNGCYDNRSTANGVSTPCRCF